MVLSVPSFGGLNRYGSHRLRCLNTLLIESGNIKRFSFVGLYVGLLEQVCHFVVDFEVYMLKLCPVWDTQFTSCCLQVKMYNFQFLLQYRYSLHTIPHDDNKLNFSPVSQIQLNVFLYTSCHGHGIPSQQ